MAALDLNGHPATGQSFDVAGPTDDGIRAVDVCDSRESLDTFQWERLGPAMKRLNVPPPVSTAWPVHSTLDERSNG